MFNDPTSIIQAAAVTPAFEAAYLRAPAEVTIDGQTYARDAARSANERVWFLAANAMNNPAAIAAIGARGLDVGELGMGVDDAQMLADPTVMAKQSALDAANSEAAAAQKTLAAAQKANAKAAALLKAFDVKIAAKEGELSSLTVEQQNVLGVKSVGDLFGSVLTLGASKGLSSVLLDTRIGNVKGALADLNTQRAEIDAAAGTTAGELKDAEREAATTAARVAVAQKALDDAKGAAMQRLREEEERKRIEEARKRSEELADRKRAAADERARAAAEAAAAAAAAQAAMPPPESYAPPTGAAGGGYFGETDYPAWEPDFSGNYEDSEGVVFGDSAYFDAHGVDDQAAMEDLWGSRDAAEGQGAMIGVNTKIDPYSFDRYYGLQGEGGGLDYLEDDAIFGVDQGTVITAVMAGVLALAPIILQQVAPPPSKSDYAGQTGNSPKSIAEEFAIRTGAKGMIDDAAKKAGENARPDFVVPAVILALVILLH